MKNFAPQLPRSRSSQHEPRKPGAQPQQRIEARDLPRVIKGSLRAHEERVKAVLRWCDLHRMPALEVYTGPRVRPNGDGSFELAPNRSNVGLSDVLTVIPISGRLVLFEVKTGKARRSPEQVRVQARFAAAGALCIEVHDVVRDLIPVEQEAAKVQAMYDEELQRVMEER